MLPYLNIPMTEDLTETDIASLEERELSILTNRGEKEEGENTEDTAEESENTENGGE